MGIVTVGQSGEVVDGGTFIETGMTDSDGLAQRHHQFALAKT